MGGKWSRIVRTAWEDVDSKEMKGAVGYEGRNGILRVMGYCSYEEYLGSSLWLIVRKQAFAANGITCKLCGCEADTLHFKQYSRRVLLGRDLHLLVPVCVQCNHTLQYNSKGDKRKFKHVAPTLSRMWLTSPANPEHVVRGKKPKGRGMNAAEFLELKDVKGRCRTCGKKARKGTLYCRPHARDVLVAR